MASMWRGLGGRLTGKMRLALLVPLAMAVAAAGGDTPPQVTLATPGSSGTGEPFSSIVSGRGRISQLRSVRRAETKFSAI